MSQIFSKPFCPFTPFLSGFIEKLLLLCPAFSLKTMRTKTLEKLLTKQDQRTQQCPFSQLLYLSYMSTCCSFKEKFLKARCNSLCMSCWMVWWRETTELHFRALKSRKAAWKQDQGKTQTVVRALGCKMGWVPYKAGAGGVTALRAFVACHSERVHRGSRQHLARIHRISSAFPRSVKQGAS